MSILHPRCIIWSTFQAKCCILARLYDTVVCDSKPDTGNLKIWHHFKTLKTYVCHWQKDISLMTVQISAMIMLVTIHFSNWKGTWSKQKIRQKWTECFHETIKDAGLFLNPEVLDPAYSTRWIKLNGAKYVTSKGCIIAVDAIFSNRMPLFGRLENIWLANEMVIFEYTPLRTLEFCSSSVAYKVEEICDFSSTNFCLSNRMLDFNTYSLVELNSELYVHQSKIWLERHHWAAYSFVIVARAN